MCKPKPVEANEMISFIACFSYNHTHVQLNPIVFHQNIGPSPSASAIRLPCTNSLGIFLLTFSPCWPALMTSQRVHYDFLCIPVHSGLFGHRCVFLFDLLWYSCIFFNLILCNSPICALFPLESTF